MPGTPTSYDNPDIRFFTYVNQNVGNNLVASITDGASGQPPVSITYTGAATQAQKTTINNIAYNTPSVFGGWAPLPVPDTAGFRHDIITDPDAPRYSQAMLLAYLVSDSSLSYSDRKAFATVATNWITTAYPTEAATVLAKINTYATNRWLPLT